MEDQVQVGGPSEEILKLVFPFLNEKELMYTSDIFNRADLVCKQWNAILKSDDVWRPICDRKIAWHEMVQRNGRAQRLESNPNMMDVEDKEYDSYNHEILATQMKKRASSGRSCREIYIRSERMGGTLLQHKLYGPDHIRPDHAISTGEDNRTLRDRCTQDYQRIVLPTINALRQVFHDPDKAMRQGDVADTKSRLLGHARKEKALLRERPSSLEKEKLAANMGQTLLAAATISFKSVGENAFSSSSNDTDTTSDITTGAIVNSLVALGAGLGTTLDWPINPVDNLSFLIRKLWINQHELDYEWNTTEEERDELWEAVMRKWWGSLADPLRRTLIEIYNEWRSRFTDGDNLPQITNANNIPREALSFIIEGKYKYFREVLAERILLKIDPSLFDSILTVYKEQTKAFIDKIYQSYKSVYEGKDPETNAKVLLDIFLEVAPTERHPIGPEMSVEYCNGLLERMQNDMDRWNQLATSSLSSDETLWNEQTIQYMDEFYQKFDTFDYLRSYRNPRNPSKEFDTGLLVERFLRQQLISPSPVCILTSRHTVQNVCEKTIKEMNNANDMSQAELALHQTKIQEAATAYENFSKYHHTREHALIALIPLLPNLSRADAKRLVYALFTKFTSERLTTLAENSLSKEFNTLWTNNIPCSPSSDLSENFVSMREWVNGNTFSGSGSHGVRDRLFGLGLPDNIISAMGEFLVERLYSTSPFDVDDHTCANAMGVLPFMARFCYENPTKASLVYDYLGQALSNATNLFSRFEAEDIAPKQRETFQCVIRRLVSTCIRTRALSLAPVLERLYDEIMDPHLPPTFVQFDALIERINDAPRVYPDTADYFEMRSIDDEI